MVIIDNTPAGELDDFHDFRTGKFKYLYYCHNCIRSFESKEFAKNCKFCHGEVRLIQAEKPVKVIPEERLFRYYCPRCEQNIESKIKLKQCQKCESDLVHLYRLEEIRFPDRLILKFLKTVKTKKIRLPKIKKKGIPAMPKINFSFRGI